MSLINITEGAIAGVDEAAKVLPLALDPILEAAIDKLVDRLQKLIVGRKITVTIE